jgi:hypothetical protein
MKNTKVLALAAGMLIAPIGGAWASDLNTLPALNQAEFKLLSEDLGAALSYKPLIPSEALGVPGFDLGLALTGTQLKNAVLLSKASNNVSVPTTLPIPTLRLTLGLPLNIDIGAQYARVPDVKMNVVGGELRWAILPGSTILPAVAIRGSMTRLQGVDQLKLATNAVDLSVSKGFVMLTPYAGVGQVWVTSTPDRTLVPTLVEEKFTQTKVFAGLNINLGINAVFEIDSTGGITSISAKAGFRF